jgi:hypothetical protein
MRLLFASTHSYVDPSGGAALCTKELLELLAARGMDCRVFCAGILDHEQETTLEEVFGGLGLSGNRLQAELSGGQSMEVLDLTVNGVRVTLMLTASSRAKRSPDHHEGPVFLDLADQVLDRFRPDVLLTYGGHPAAELQSSEDTAPISELVRYGVPGTPVPGTPTGQLSVQTPNDDRLFVPVIGTTPVHSANVKVLYEKWFERAFRRGVMD